MCGVIVTLQLRVGGFCILMAEDHDNDDQIVQEVFHLMRSVCQWKEWTDSQWVRVTIGDIGRSFFGALLLGIGDHIVFAIQHGHAK